MVGQAQITLGKAAARYVGSLPAADRADVERELQQFLRWYGVQRPLDEVRPYELDAYASTVTSTTANGRKRLEVLRAFLAYAKRTGMTETNLGVHVRLPSVRNRDKATTERNPNVVRLTPEGIARLQQELAALQEQRPQLADQLRQALEDKDFRENAPLDAAREEQAHVEARIREIENILRHAVTMQPGDGSDGSVQVGSTVCLRSIDTNTEMRYTLVERSEVNPGQGRISIESPMGQALLGRRPGDEVQVQAPGGTRTFRLEAIET